MAHDPTSEMRSHDGWTRSQTSSHDQHLVDHQHVRMAIWGVNGTNGLIRTSHDHETRIKVIEDIVAVGTVLASTGVTIIKVAKWAFLFGIFGLVMSGPGHDGRNHRARAQISERRFLMTRFFTSVFLCMTVIAGSTLGAKVAMKWAEDKPPMAARK